MIPERMPSVVRALACEAGMVAGIVAEAFEQLEMAVWLVGDPLTRREVLRGWFSILVEHAVEYGRVDVLDDCSGAAVWLHHDPAIATPPPRDYKYRFAAACGGHAPRFQVLDDLLVDHRPGERHHNLALLAVVPDWQRTGRGTVLLRHHHQVLDEQDVPSYLEAMSPGGIRLCAGEGYRHCGSAFALPDGTVCHPMWRTPGRRDPSDKKSRRHLSPIPSPVGTGGLHQSRGLT